MSRHQAANTVFLSLILSLVACGPDPVRPDDALPDASMPVDAGEEPVDAGEEPVDAGEEPVDAGEEPADAGEEPVDAGEEPADAGEEPADAGEEPVDAGEEGADLDSDCDGLSDLVERTTLRAGGYTDPDLIDTDGDGIPDGQELGVTGPLEGTDCVIVADADPSTTTDPLSADTDGDGIEDGLEDTNGNGRVDEGESDPTVADEHPLVSACARDVLRTTQDASLNERLVLALGPDAVPVPVLDDQSQRGLMVLDASGVALAAMELEAPEGVEDLEGVALELRQKLQAGMTRQVERSRRLPDGSAALRLIFEVSTNVDPVSHANALVEALLPGSTGRLVSPSQESVDLRIEALLARRDDGSVLVLLAVSPRASTAEASYVARSFVSGAALSAPDAPLRQVCESVVNRQAAIDLLFVVDDSGSMASTHGALAAGIPSFIARLEAAGIDWRAAAVTSSYHNGTRANSGVVRGFTRNPLLLQAWFTVNSFCSSGRCTGVPESPEPAVCPASGANGGCWVGLSGSGTEAVLGAARKAIDVLAPESEQDEELPSRLRPEARVAVVLVGDADDQTASATATQFNCGTGGSLDVAGTGCEPVSSFSGYFGDASGEASNPTGAAVVVHGLVCPSGRFCGCTDTTRPCEVTNTTREFNPQPLEGRSQLRHAAVVQASGGVLGSIVNAGAVSFGLDAVADDLVARSGRPLRLGPVVPETVKVAVGQVQAPDECQSVDVPPGTASGYDFDAEYGTLILYGACRPVADAPVAVSYGHR